MKKWIALLLSFALLITACALPAAAAGTITEEGLLLYYTFDDGKATDSSKNGKDGVGYGTLKTVPGVSGNAMYFSGGYVQLPEMDFTGLSAFTFSAWVAPMGTANYARVASFGSRSAYSLDLLAPYMQNKFDALYIVDDAVNHVTAPTAYKVGAWKHLVMTYSNSDHMLTLYVDGEKAASEAVDTSISRLGVAANCLLGRSQKQGLPEYYGLMDEVRVYGRALEETEIMLMTANGQRSLAQSVLSNLSLAEENGLSNLDAVMQDLTLPASDDAVASDAVLTYSSNKPEVLGDDGKVGSVSEPTAVQLTVTARREGFSARTTLPITVVPKGERKADPVAVTTTLGTKPSLPGRISANNGSASVAVTWNTPETSAYAAMYALAGSFTVDGLTEEGEAITASITVDDTLFCNPIVQPASPDPFITYRDGWYYYIKSSGGVNVAKARRLQDIGSAPLVNVFDANQGYKEFWAPELHYVDGCWYIYAAPVPTGSGRRRMYVLKATVPDDPQSPFEMVGKMGPTVYNEETGKWELNTDTTQDRYALDGTVLEVGDKRYFIYSAHTGVGSQPTTQRLYINEMADAATLMGDRVLLPAGGAAFEKRQNDIGNSICEGPQVFQKNGKVFIIYSTDQSNHDWYQLCLLYADADSDLLNPESWTKYPGPLMTKSDNPLDESYATGHACVVSSPDGTEDWLIYHAYQTHNNNFTGDQEARCARAIKVSYDEETGLPIFGNPAPYSEVIAEPSGTASQVALKFEAESADLSGGASIRSGVNRASGRKVVENISGAAKVSFTFQLPTAGRYLISLVGTSSQGNNNSRNIVTVNGEAQYSLTYRVTYNGAYRFIPSYLSDAEQLGSGLYVELKAGENTLTVTDDATADGTVDLDYLYLLLDADPVYTVALEKDTADLQVGETLALAASVTPNDRSTAATVRWSSSNPEVASVDGEGKVTALAVGEAVITASLPGGSTASCTLTVAAAPEPEVLPGDVDNDGKVTVSDVVALRRLIIAGAWTDREFAAGNLDDTDEILTVSDVVALRSLIVRGDSGTKSLQNAEA